MAEMTSESKVEARAKQLCFGTAPNYSVRVTREGKDWLAEVTNLQGVSTWATTFSGLDRNVREAIALAENLPDGAEEKLWVSWDLPVTSPELSHAYKVAEQRRLLVHAQEDLLPEVRKTIEALTNEGWSVRDQAALLGMTAGRVSQLATS
ncbi:hypothetical protein HMPREF0294_2225 [Corynebacterium glucuronolyticum ATCC 51867]|nr:hypothetical protein HMPREF0294_2225 [Corynebacterium glucuronolyticum ATCC 51867]